MLAAAWSWFSPGGRFAFLFRVLMLAQVSVCLGETPGTVRGYPGCSGSSLLSAVVLRPPTMSDVVQGRRLHLQAGLLASHFQELLCLGTKAQDLYRGWRGGRRPGPGITPQGATSPQPQQRHR